MLKNATAALAMVLAAGWLVSASAQAQDESQARKDQRTETNPSQVGPDSGSRKVPEQAQPKSRDQSAQAPQTPAVIPPPATGDSNVISPPATGAAKGPVIAPPGTPGGDQTLQPK